MTTITTTTTSDCPTINNETLAHLVIINHMVTTTGCTHEQAKQLLISSEWKLEVKLILSLFEKNIFSFFFQAAINLLLDERTMPIPCCKFSEVILFNLIKKKV